MSQDARLWIVENPAGSRWTGALMERLRRQGVEWAALEPVSPLALLASPRLARARSRWGHLLPRATPVWIGPGPGRSPGDLTLPDQQAAEPAADTAAEKRSDPVDRVRVPDPGGHGRARRSGEFIATPVKGSSKRMSITIVNPMASPRIFGPRG